MRLSVATNFEPELVEALAPYPVVELFGKLRKDAAGGGRASYQLAPISKRRLAEHVEHARSKGMGFNYLMNAACHGNQESTRQGQRAFEKLLGWVTSLGIPSVTVATPQLLTLIKTRYPHLRVRVSLFGGVDRVQKARMWEDLGADCIVLDGMLVNRELGSLANIRKHLSCDLELLVNNSCLQSCALSPSHMTGLAHASKSTDPTKSFFIDWCFLKCTQMKLSNPVNYIRSEWIRPEDLHIYEELGYDLFKIAERDIPTPIMVRRVKAYAERRYDGNLLDLVQPYGFSTGPDRRYYRTGLRKLAWGLRFALRPRKVNPLRMLPIKRLAEVRGLVQPLEGETPVYVDNRALDGFMERFRTEGCRDRACEECRWCHRFAERAVRIEPNQQREALAAYQEIFRSLDSGHMWKWGRGKESEAPLAQGGAR